MIGTALITGGQRGIGFGIAQALAANGFQIAIASLPEAEDPDVATTLAALGEKAAYFQHDMRDVAGVDALLDKVGARFGPVTCFVGNAGIGAPVRGDMLDVPPESFDVVLDVNLRGGFFLAQAVAKRMMSRGDEEVYRSFSFITSVSAEMASVERAEYCISKAGASMMARLFALRLAPHGIGVFELQPGIVATDMTAGVQDTYEARIADGLVPAGRMLHPQDIAEVVTAIATGQLRSANGAVIPVDGGLSIPKL